MKYIKPPVQTICVGQAFGAAAMILSQGAKGNRACLPKFGIIDAVRVCDRCHLDPDL